MIWEPGTMWARQGLSVWVDFDSEIGNAVPVAEGGGSCQLDNLRTLCRRCHGAETAALAKRRAAARKKGGERG